MKNGHFPRLRVLFSFPVVSCVLWLLLSTGFTAPARADVVNIDASKDNTMYSENGARSDGTGDGFFTGRTKNGVSRRGLIAFNVAVQIPPGSTINFVTLQLYASRTKNNTLRTTSLYRALRNWGESTSLAGQGGGGQGGPAAPGDATWTCFQYPDSLWTSPGGDYATPASAATQVGSQAGYSWTSAQMAADVQNWLDSPATNFGWVVIGDEIIDESAKRFDSRTSGTIARRPSLVVDFTPPAGGQTGACCLPGDTCVVTTAFDCTAQGGTYQGDNTVCTPDPCGGTPVTVTLTALKDNTLYEDAGGALSNGAGDYLFTGKNNGGLRRRAVLAFSLATVPAGAMVSSATLTLRTTQGGGGTSNVAAHRALASWGEGTSNAGGGEQNGAASTTGDATWIHRFYNTQSWTAAGGDYAPTASATTAVADQAFYGWSGAGLVADVQGWVDDPAANFGWVMIGVENAATTEKRFASRQYVADATFQPKLEVTFTVPSPDATGACCFNDGSCDTLTEAECMAQGGTYQGDDTTCMEGLCPLVLEPFVDSLTVPPLAMPVSGTPGGVATYDMTMVEFEKRLHRDLPPTTVWGYNGYYPGPTILATPGNPVTVNWINDLRDSTGALRTEHYLPVDLCMHGPDSAGTGARTVVHLHGGHVPQESDGYPDSTFNPGESRTYVYPNNQDASLIWYHDHALGITRLNVMMGLAGGYLITDAVEAALNLPSGAYDVPLIIQDRSFHPDGSLKYPSTWEDHFFGEVAVVNGTVWPWFQVDRGVYRLRLLGGSNSRVWTLSFSNGAPFTVIGGDGGLLEAPVVRDSLTLTPGERIDVLVDFSSFAPGTEILLLNSAQAPFPNGDPMHDLPQVMKFVVGAQSGYAYVVPSLLRTSERLQEGDATQHRDFTLEKTSDPCAGQVWTINGMHWDHITEFPVLGETEVWRFINKSGTVHPMHMHLVFFQVLDRTPFTMVGDSLVYGTPVAPDPSQSGWKDTVPVYPNEAVRVIARFEDYTGRYAYHCHILEHEDHEMMRQFEVVAPGTAYLTISDASVAEGDTGTVTATFVVDLLAPSGQTVMVDYTTADGSATAPSDYIATSGMLMFAPGDTSRTVTVQVVGDLDYESDETFRVILGNAMNAVLADSEGVGTIGNDDAVSGIGDGPLANRLALLPAYPNPSSGITRMAFHVPVESRARLEVFDVAGRLVATVFNGLAGAGREEATWDSRDRTGERVPGGLYFYRLTVPGHPVQTRKLMILN
jgi:spore coat protein A